MPSGVHEKAQQGIRVHVVKSPAGIEQVSLKSRLLRYRLVHVQFDEVEIGHARPVLFQEGDDRRIAIRAGELNPWKLLSEPGDLTTRAATDLVCRADSTIRKPFSEELEHRQIRRLRFGEAFFQIAFRPSNAGIPPHAEVFDFFAEMRGCCRRVVGRIHGFHEGVENRASTAGKFRSAGDPMPEQAWPFQEEPLQEGAGRALLSRHRFRTAF